MGDRARQSKAYTLLALEVGRRAGLNMPSPQAVARLYKAAGKSSTTPEPIEAAAKAVAEATPVREQRDVLWMEYERMLRDEKTYTQTGVLKWLADHGAKTSTASVNRDSMAVRAATKAMTMRAQLARDMVEMCKGGETSFLQAARQIVAQKYFDALLNLEPDALEGLTATQVLRMMEAVGAFARDDAATDLSAERLRQMESAFDAQMKELEAKAAGGGGITAEDLANARKIVHGG